jgi:hypothetical protein
MKPLNPHCHVTFKLWWKKVSLHVIINVVTHDLHARIKLPQNKQHQGKVQLREIMFYWLTKLRFYDVSINLFSLWVYVYSKNIWNFVFIAHILHELELG